MRELLFRGKRKDNGEWAEGSLLYDSEQNEGFIAEDFEDRAAYLREVIPETVGQYTGLTDKNGKKIFEGDIILYSWRDNKDKKPFYIEFFDGEFRATPKNIANDIWSIRICGYACDSEVIGNIHDKPELLEEMESESK